MLRAQIIRAAIRQFAKHGYHATSTKQIARSAKVAEMTLFRTFGSKARLFHECLHHVFEQGTPPPEGEPLECISRYILTLAETFIRHPEYPLLIDQCGLAADRAARNMVVKQNLLLSERLKTWLRQAQLDGTLRLDVDLDAITYSLLANLFAVKELCIKFPTCRDCLSLLRKVLAQMLDQYRVPNS